MNKYAFLILISFTSVFLLHPMERFDDNMREWPSIKLRILLEQALKQKNSTSMFDRGYFKEEFVEKYVEKYDDQQEILKYLCKETSGVIRATADPELAQKDPNKFYCIDLWECTAQEIDARGKRIHHADCKYFGPD